MNAWAGTGLPVGISLAGSKFDPRRICHSVQQPYKRK